MRSSPSWRQPGSSNAPAAPWITNPRSVRTPAQGRPVSVVRSILPKALEEEVAMNVQISRQLHPVSPLPRAPWCASSSSAMSITANRPDRPPAARSGRPSDGKLDALKAVSAAAACRSSGRFCSTRCRPSAIRASPSIPARSGCAPRARYRPDRRARTCRVPPNMISHGSGASRCRRADRRRDRGRARPDPSPRLSPAPPRRAPGDGRDQRRWIAWPSMPASSGRSNPKSPLIWRDWADAERHYPDFRPQRRWRGAAHVLERGIEGRRFGRADAFVPRARHTTWRAPAGASGLQVRRSPHHCRSGGEWPIRAGDDILIMPAAKPACVKSIEVMAGARETADAALAIAGQSVGITLDREIFLESATCCGRSPQRPPGGAAHRGWSPASPGGAISRAHRDHPPSSRRRHSRTP